MPTTFTRISAIAGIAGSALTLIGILIDGSDPSHNFFGAPFYGIGILLIITSLVGLLRAGRNSSNLFMDASLALALLGLLSTALFILLSILSHLGVGSNDWTRNPFLIGLLATFLGVGLYGVGGIATGSLPRWAGLPLGIGGLAAALLGGAMSLVGDNLPEGTWVLLLVVALSLFVITLAGWAAATSTLLFKDR